MCRGMNPNVHCKDRCCTNTLSSSSWHRLSMRELFCIQKSAQGHRCSIVYPLLEAKWKKRSQSNIWPSVGRLNILSSIILLHRKFSIRGEQFYEDCCFTFSKIPLGTVWFLAKTVLFFPRHVLLQLITDLDESSQNRCKDMFSFIGNGQSVIDRCIAVLTLSQRHTAICKWALSAVFGQMNLTVPNRILTFGKRHCS